MNFLDLFAGSRSFAKEAEKRGHNVFSVDVKAFKGIDLVKDIEFLTTSDIPFIPDAVFSGTPCTTYSVAAIHVHRYGTHPLTDFAYKCDRMNENVNNLLTTWKSIYYIENPRGMLRKMPFMQHHDRTTVTYCSYGDTRMKPTDIFSNNIYSLFNPLGFNPKPLCHNYKYNSNGEILKQHCKHEAAPRGETIRKLKGKGIIKKIGGTSGLKNNYERSKIPSLLCKDLIIAAENTFNQLTK